MYVGHEVSPHIMLSYYFSKIRGSNKLNATKSHLEKQKVTC